MHVVASRQICVISTGTSSRTPLEKEVRKTVNFYNLIPETITCVNSVNAFRVKTLHQLDIHCHLFTTAPSCNKSSQVTTPQTPTSTSSFLLMKTLCVHSLRCVSITHFLSSSLSPNTLLMTPQMLKICIHRR